MITIKKQQSGFTLMELIVYLALFGILFGGALVGAYSIIESSGRNQNKVMMQGEGGFLLAKINWVVSSANSAQIPEGDHLIASVLSDKFEFKKDGNNMVLIKNLDPTTEVILNNSAVQVKNLSFIDLSLTNAGQKGIKYEFDLESNTPNGAVIKSNFQSIVYLRK